MSKTPRFPSIINRFIEEKWLKHSPSYFTEHDSNIPDILDQNKLITPFRGTFSGVSITDGYYSIPATSSISLPQDSMILVTDWNLSYTNRLEIEIIHADLLAESRSLKDTPIISIESNPSVAYLIRKFVFERIRNDLLEPSQEEDLEFIKSEYEPSQGTEGILHRVDEVLLTTPVVQIGFGQNSHKKAQEFSKSRTKGKIEEDLMKMLEPEVVENEDQERKKIGISVNYDIGIDVFPAYALDYLKHKYNLLG